MVARTNVISHSGAVLSISAGLPVTYDLTGYTDTDVFPTYTPVNQVENWGNHGVSAAVSSFTPIDTAVTSKIKGAKDYGTMSLIIGSVPADPGQVILKAASESNLHYTAQLAYPDGEVHYLDVLVTKYENQDGAVGDVQKIACDLAICRKPVISPAP